MALGPIILGLNWSARHDSSAAIIADNVLLAACEEERFSRIKHDSAFPAQSIDYCLKAAGLKHRDLDGANGRYDRIGRNVLSLHARSYARPALRNEILIL